MNRHLRTPTIDVEDVLRLQPSLQYGLIFGGSYYKFFESILAESKSQRHQLVLLLYSVSVLNSCNYYSYATLFRFLKDFLP
jgi:hypothetical protein